MSPPSDENERRIRDAGEGESGKLAAPGAASAPSQSQAPAPPLDDLLALTRNLTGCRSPALVSTTIFGLEERSNGEAAASLRTLVARSGGHLDSLDPGSGILALWAPSARWTELATALRARGGPFGELSTVPPTNADCALLLVRYSSRETR